MENFVFVDKLKIRKSRLTVVMNMYHDLNYYLTVEIIEKQNYYDTNDVYILSIYRPREVAE